MKSYFIKVLTLLIPIIFIASCNGKGSAENKAPIALDDNATLSSENNFTIDIFKNDYDIDGTIDINSTKITQMPKFGDIALIDKKIKYVPKKILCGKDSFKYKVADNLGKYSNIAEANVSFCIKRGGKGGSHKGGHKGGNKGKHGGGGKGNNCSKNYVPEAKSDTIVIKKDSAKDVKLKATDKDGDNLKYIIVTKPKHGKLSGKAPNLIYTPDKNYTGDDSFSFKANDGKVDSNIATITIEVVSVNRPPIADAGKDYTGIKGDVVKFDGSKSRDLDGNITKYIWSEGNVTLSTKVKFEMKFMKVGVHKITLTVTDDENATDSNEKIVTIKECCKRCVYPDPIATNPFK